MNSREQETDDMYTVNCCFKHSIVSLHLCKEYLTAVKLKTFFLRQISTERFDIWIIPL